MKLHDLVPNIGSKKNRKRVGRGISAGQGKTAGRGTKGAGARSGEGGHAYRQGGNLPFFRRLPFMRGEGFTPPNQVFYNEVNLDQLAIECFNTEYEPEQFPGLVYRLDDPKTVMLIFRSGKTIITGAKNLEDIRLAAERTREMVHQYNAIIGQP